MADIQQAEAIPTGISRRQFIKGAIAGGAVVSATGYLFRTVSLLSQNGRLDPHPIPSMTVMNALSAIYRTC